MKTLVEGLVEDLAGVTLIDEDTKSIPTDGAKKEIPSNMRMQVAPPGGQIFPTNASGATLWPNFLPMQVAPPVDQISNQCKRVTNLQVAPPGVTISYKCKWRHLVAKFSSNSSGANHTLIL